MGFEFLKNVKPKEAMKMLDDIRDGQLHAKKYIDEHRKDFRNKADYDTHNTKYRRKVFSIPAVVYFSNPEYWGRVALDRKLQKLHPEFRVKS